MFHLTAISMKSHALLLVLIFPLYVQAQSSPETPWLKKGEIQIGVGVGRSWGGYTGFAGRTTPYVQYFIKDRWSVRLEGEYEIYQLSNKRNQGAGRSQGFGIGVSTQYYFLKRDRFALYGKVGYNNGRSRFNVYDPFESSSPPLATLRSNYNRLSLGVGAQYRLGERWLLNGLIEQQAINQRFKSTSTHVSIGVGFRIK